jgi:hypothetical protein
MEGNRDDLQATVLLPVVRSLGARSRCGVERTGERGDVRAVSRSDWSCALSLGLGSAGVGPLESADP